MNMLVEATPPGQPRRRSLVVRTDDEILTLDDGGAKRRCRIPEELRERDFFWLELPGGDFLASAQWRWDESSGKAHYRLFWFDAEGRVSRQEEADLQQGRPNRLGLFADLRVFLATMFPEPLVIDGFGLVAWALRQRYVRNAATFTEAFGRALEELWPALLVVQVVAGVLAWLAHRRQVRYHSGRAERIAWTVFVLLAGVPGWLAYRYGQSWPVLEPCPACGARVAINRDSCPACRTETPPPALKGTEVFA
jgi:hypothetical protein